MAEKKAKAFTLIEVIVAIALFSTGLIGYMAFQNHAATVSFDADSSRTANQLAVELMETISSMTPKSFSDLTQQINPDQYYKDFQIAAYLPGLRDADNNLNNAGPFDHRGSPLNGNESGHYLYYRFLRIQQYVIETNKVGLYNPGSDYDNLMHIEITVVWPKRHNHEVACNIPNPNPQQCNRISISLVKNRRTP